MAGIPARGRRRAGAGDPVVMMGGRVRVLQPRAHGPVHGLDRGRRRGGGRRRRSSRRGARAGARRRRGARAGSSSRSQPLVGIYRPDAYAVRYAADGLIEAVEPSAAAAPAVVVKRRLRERRPVRDAIARSRRPRPSTGTCSSSRSARDAGGAAGSVSRGRCTGPVRHRSLESLRESVAEIAKESAPRGAGGRVRVGLPVDRRADEAPRGVRGRGVDLLAARRQPHRGPRGLARSAGGTAR